MPTLTHLHHYLERNAVEYAHKAAFVEDGRTVSWRELADEVQVATAALLSSMPASEEQQIIGLLLPNSIDFIVAYLAIVSSGNIALPLDMIFKQHELEAITNQVPPVLVVTNAQCLDRLETISVPVVTVDDLKTAPADAPAPLELPAEAQIASMLFTSGTTGRPKAAPYTHGNHLWNISVSSELYAWTDADTILLSLPLSHWHGLVMGVSGALYNANTVYIQDRLEAGSTLDMMASGKISLFMHVSLAYTKLLNHEPETSWDLTKVRLCISASSALPPPIWHGFKKRFGLEILERYGSSEAGQIASNRLDDRVPGSPGTALPGEQLILNEAGEILVKSPGVFPGYWNNPEATAASYTEDGWWRTGDLAKQDEQGHVFLKGRIQERIKKQGYSVFPRDVEWALQDKNPAVAEVFVMGTPHPDGSSDQIAYFVVGTITEEDVRSYSKEHMPSAWRPDRVIILEAIPRTRSGKPVLSALRALLEN